MITVAQFLKSNDFPFKKLYALPVKAENLAIRNEIAAYISSLGCKGNHTQGRTCRFCK